MLYLIEILHQTTTHLCFFPCRSSLYLIEILHQTTTRRRRNRGYLSCILSKFYIKPQRAFHLRVLLWVVSYRNSTSNHNVFPQIYIIFTLYLIEILHQTTTISDLSRFCCMLYLIEILHQTTTSIYKQFHDGRLYLIEILHQTTTLRGARRTDDQLYLIEILHQTTTAVPLLQPWSRCILSKFYIKPQHVSPYQIFSLVVSYRNSTSNHNLASSAQWLVCVVSYRNSTSNHNGYRRWTISIRLYLIEILHQTTTGTANINSSTSLYLIEILHQTTTEFRLLDLFWSCILSKFYIKPQLIAVIPVCRTVVSYRNSTSNHNIWTKQQLTNKLYLIEILHQTTTYQTRLS